MARKLQKEKNLEEISKFILSLTLLSLPLYLIIIANLEFKPLQASIANIIGYLLSSSGYRVYTNQNIIKIKRGVNSYVIDISWDSTGWKSMYFLFSLLLATPSVDLTKKLRFMSIGIASIFVFNLLRIYISSIVLINYGSGVFDFVHDLLWAQGMIIFTLAIWFLWLRTNTYKYSGSHARAKRKRGR